MQKYYVDKLYILNVLELSLKEIYENSLVCPKCSKSELRLSSIGISCRCCELNEVSWDIYRTDTENIKELEGFQIDYQLYNDLYETMNNYTKSVLEDIDEMAEYYTELLSEIDFIVAQVERFDCNLNRLRDRLELDIPNSEFIGKILNKLEINHLITENEYMKRWKNLIEKNKDGKNNYE